MNSLLFVTLVGYSAWLVLGSPSESPRVIGVAVGVALWMLGVSLRWWAIAALGRNWRIGQDDSDERATFVATGPYRLLRHPINATPIVVAVGMLLMTGPDPRSLLLLSVSVLYYVVQARAENRRWRQRSGT